MRSPAHVIRMRHRPVALRDLPECMALLPAGLQPHRPDIAALWPALVDQPAVLSAVMEDMAQPPGSRVLGWGVSMIMSAGMAAGLGLDGAPQPFLARRVYEGLRDGRWQLPDDREIGRANAAGTLRLLIPHFTMPTLDLRDPRALAVVSCANDSFRAFHDGYQWQAMLVESSLAMQPAHVHSGFVARPWADESGLQELAPDIRPALSGLDRDEARLQLPGTTVRQCFEFQPPRFRFSATQRRLLWRALFDEDDDTLMAHLGTSVHGLKKLWRGIYDRVADVEPAFFGDAGSGDEGKRGPEKRRHVLAYVRQRPEELRPWGG